MKDDSDSSSGHEMWASAAPRAAGTTRDAGGATIYLHEVAVVELGHANAREPRTRR